MYIIDSMLSTDAFWHGVELPGCAKAKEAGIIRPNKSRGLLPQPAYAQVAHRVVRGRIEPVLNEFSEKAGTMRLIRGAVSGCQPLDIAFAAQRVLEVGRDRRGEAGVALADIANYHDSISWGAFACQSNRKRCAGQRSHCGR